MAKLTITELPTEGDAPSRFQVRNRETDIAAESTEIPDPHLWPVPGAGDEPLMSQLRWYLETFLDYPFDPYTRRAEVARLQIRAENCRIDHKLPQCPNLIAGRKTRKNRIIVRAGWENSREAI